MRKVVSEDQKFRGSLTGPSDGVAEVLGSAIWALSSRATPLAADMAGGRAALVRGS